MSAARDTMQRGRCAPLNEIVGTMVSLHLSLSLSLSSSSRARPGFIPVVVRLLPFFTEFHPSVFSLSLFLSQAYCQVALSLPYARIRSISRPSSSPFDSHRSSSRLSLVAYARVN